MNRREFERDFVRLCRKYGVIIESGYALGQPMILEVSGKSFPGPYRVSPTGLQDSLYDTTERKPGEKSV